MAPVLVLLVRSVLCCFRVQNQTQPDFQGLHSNCSQALHPLLAMQGMPSCGSGGEQAGIMYIPPIAPCTTFMCFEPNYSYLVPPCYTTREKKKAKTKTQLVAPSPPFPPGQERGGNTSVQHLTVYRGEVFSVVES